MGEAVLFTVAGEAVTVSTALTAAGAGLAAFAAVQQGQAAAAEAKFQGDVAARQAEIARQQAEREKVISRQSEEDFRRQTAAAFGTRRAVSGVTGVEPATGSSLLASEDFASEAELQALRIRSGGEVRTTRLQQLAGQREAEGGFFRDARGPLRRGGVLRGGSLLLSGAGTAFA